MNRDIFNNKKITNHPLVQCIHKTDVLCDFNKKTIYKILGISFLPGLKYYILNQSINLPSQNDEIKELFEKVLPQNERSVNILIEEYEKIKKTNSHSFLI